MSSLCFGIFELDLKTGELRKAGTTINLPPQPFKILALLASRTGQLVTREEIQQQIWGSETFVDFEQGLNFAIKRIRGALGDDAETPRYIETLPRRGYRFIAPVEKVADRTAGATGFPQPNHDAAPLQLPVGQAAGPGIAAAALSSVGMPRPEPRTERTGWRYAITLAVGAILALAIVLVGLDSGGLRQRFFTRLSAGKIQSIAVLPLENLSGDPAQEYFADGMTDAVITDLAQIGALRVISRTSAMQYKGTKKPLPQIARELNVEAVVEGAVVRSGNRVKITAQLIQAATDRHLWAKSYERDLHDIIGLQLEVAQAVAAEIRAELSPQANKHLASARSVNPEAYETYLKGRFFWNKYTPEGWLKGIEYFNEAIHIDPSYAPAYAGGCSRVAGFEAFKANLRAGELLKNGRRIRLQEQPFQILAILLEHPGEVVTREELRPRLWPADTFVDFDHGLNNAINRLREALGDSVDSPRYIETLPRRGGRCCR